MLDATFIMGHCLATMARILKGCHDAYSALRHLYALAILIMYAKLYIMQNDIMDHNFIPQS